MSNERYSGVVNWMANANNSMNNIITITGSYSKTVVIPRNMVDLALTSLTQGLTVDINVNNSDAEWPEVTQLSLHSK